MVNNSVSPPTIAWTNQMDSTRMDLINDIQYSSAASTYFVCGERGYMAYLVSGVWRRMTTNIIDNLNAIKLTSSTTGFLAADNGKIFSFIISGGWIVTCTEVPTTVSVNLNDILVNGNALMAVGDEGTILFSNNITTTPLVRLNFNSTSDLHGVALRPGTVPAYTTVGENSTITLSFGGLVLQQKNVALPQIRSISFTDANNGFILADRFNIRQTSDGGVNWTPIKPGATINANYPVLNRILATTAGKGIVVGNNRWYADISNNYTTQVTVGNFSASTATNLMDVATNGNVIFVAAQNSTNGQLWQKTGAGAWALATNAGPGISGTPLRKVHMFNNGNVLVVGTNGRIAYYNDVTNTITNWAAPTGLTTNTWLSIYFHDDLNGYVVGANGAVLKTSNNSLNGSGYHIFGSWVRMGTDDNLNSQTDSTLMNIQAIGFANRNNGFIGGSYNGTPAGYARRVNDRDGRYSTLFWYDKLGRIVLSQNTKQASTPTNERRYSYTRYDALGRVFEAGELTDTVTLASGTAFRDIFGDYIANYYNPDVINDDSLTAFIGNNLRKEVTRSYYDSTWINSTPSGFAQNHLRKRIAHVTYEETYDGIDTTYDHATHYSYDIHGNV
ncbi:MAG TPA: hypothetical protein PK637_15845, partial [Flavobacteriales bacterium]|nr:hypothetical protein [Flavobacteriales bacterium]